MRPSSITRGSAVAAPSLPAGPSGKLIVCSSFRSDSRQIWTAWVAAVRIHVGGRGDDSVERGDDRGGIGANGTIDTGQIGRGGADDLAMRGDLREPARCDAGRVVLHLECGKDIPVGQAQVTVRVHHAGDITELPVEPWRGRVAHVEDEGPTRSEAVDEQASVGRHLVLAVMRAIPAAGHRHRGDEPSVPAGVLGHVEHSQEVGPGRVGRAGPDVEVFAWRGSLGRGRACREQEQDGHESRVASHERSPLKFEIFIRQFSFAVT